MPEPTAAPEAAPEPVSGELVPAADPAALETALPPGVQPSRNYVKAIELGHVLAQSGYYRDARDPAKAAVKVMIGMDLGVSPTASLQAIHTMEEDGRTVFLIEAKLLAAVVKARPDVEYKIIERGPEKVTARFLRQQPDGKMEPEGPDVTWTIEHAREAVKGFGKKPTWKSIPEVMLTWRVLAEGFRLYFPDVLAGQPIYTMEEFGTDADETGAMQDALTPDRPQPLANEKAEQQRAAARAIYEELKEINPERLPPGRFHQMVSRAEHSHEQLDGVIASLTDLRDTEKRIAELTEQLEGKLTKSDLKALLGRAERRGSNRERIELLEAAVGEQAAGDEAEAKGGEADADA